MIRVNVSNEKALALFNVKIGDNYVFIISFLKSYDICTNIPIRKK